MEGTQAAFCTDAPEADGARLIPGKILQVGEKDKGQSGPLPQGRTSKGMTLQNSCWARLLPVTPLSGDRESSTLLFEGDTRGKVFSKAHRTELGEEPRRIYLCDPVCHHKTAKLQPGNPWL